MSNSELVDKQLEAYNNLDIDSFIACYSDDIEVFMLESNQLLTKGIEQLRSTMKKSFESNPKSKTTLISRIEQKNLVIDIEKITGHIEDKTTKSLAIYEIIENRNHKLWFGGRILEQL